MTPRLYVTGTDTDVGKTLIAAATGRVLRDRYGDATIVKVAQTGLDAAVPGDAQFAGELASCEWLELARFPKPADAWTAALAAGRPPVRAAEAAERIDAVRGPLVVEGSGGAAVPLNERETITDVAARCNLDALVVVDLRLGCLNHAALTIEYLERRNVRIRGIVCCERRPVDATYPDDVRRVLAQFGIDIALVRFETRPDARFDAASAAIARLLG
jgi:dethiobiotin synthase